MSRPNDDQEEYGDPHRVGAFGELTIEIVAIFLLVGSISGYTSLLSTYPRDLRFIALLALLANLLLPLIVYIDMRRNMGEPSYLWVHATTMPVLNIVGVLGYIADRDRLFRENCS